MKDGSLFLLYAIVLAVLAQPFGSKSCSSSISPHLRKDCHPEAGASEASCLAKKCCWAPSKTPGIPWCFEKTDGCSMVAASQRIDCHPEPGASEAKCRSRGCQWCQTDNSNVPFCFYYSKEEAACANSFPFQNRIDCHPQPGATQATCEAKGCVWCSSSLRNVPWCFYPADGPHGYAVDTKPQRTEKGWRVILTKRDTISLFGNDISPIAMDVEFHTKDRLRFKIYDPNNKRFEVPLNIESPPTAAADPNYDIEFLNGSFLQFRITRKSTGTVLWDTSLGGLTFSEQFMQMLVTLPSDSVYGFGEHEHPSFKHDMNFIRYGMFTRDHPPMAFSNLYGVHPFYMCVEKDFNTHGVLLLNSNAQDITLSPSPSITFRTIGGILDFYMFLGPTPENVVQQYTEAIGRPYFPPYWSLGFQLCRWGYDSLDVLKETVDRMRKYDIPFDVQYGDIDYMDRRLDFTYDKVNFAGLPEYIQELKKDGMHYVIILDPFLTKDEPQGTYRAYELGEEMGVWIKNSDGVTPAVGKAWPPGNSVFPDYTNPKTVEWWIQMCVEFKDVLDYDGIWIDMNEPANFGAGQNTGCTRNKLNNPPYVPDITDELLAEKTLCPDSKTYLGNHYDTHSLFGWSQTEPTFYASQNATGKRAFVLSRSTFVGSGKHTGHWLGDNFSRWRDMHMSIIGMLEFNLFGIPYIGADICGFNEETTYELCLRWMQLGAFYPFSRNHNAIGLKEQDPAVFGAEFAEISRSALMTRYTLLPYLYTLFYHSHVSGNTVVRGLMHEFISDPQTHAIDRAFLWGPAFMITPVLEEGARAVDVYFPEATWFNYYTGDQVPDSWLKKSVRVPAPLETIPLFIRGGYILPTQAPARTTVLSRLNPFGLIIALNKQGEASGSLFWDDGDSIGSIENGDYFFAQYKFSKGQLKTTLVRNGYRGVDTLTFDTVHILGVSSKPNVITVNGKMIQSKNFHYHPNGKLTLQISELLAQKLTITLQ
ncbi:sucrase-isomaltase, intestinal-like [Ornithorhynchus anatinus]|uniref:sucrase-isomaltase, intestinal-like n=1 Tax=Ornithorhynchus anatinus TaxID=9258 RepID=UPI0010A8E1C1|nr:sucrase-isomaltase, intestinal-like [Ornithorhynchus anatinus]